MFNEKEGESETTNRKEKKEKKKDITQRFYFLIAASEFHPHLKLCEKPLVWAVNMGMIKQTIDYMHTSQRTALRKHSGILGDSGVIYVIHVLIL